MCIHELMMHCSLSVYVIYNNNYYTVYSTYKALVYYQVGLYKNEGPTLDEMSYALAEITENQNFHKAEAIEIRNHFSPNTYSVKSHKLLAYFMWLASNTRVSRLKLILI